MRPDDDGGSRRALGAELRRLRHARGLTLRDAATKAGLSYQLLGQIEKDGQATTTEKLLDVVAALGGRLEVLDASTPRVPELPSERTEIARAFLDVLPFIPADELDVFIHEIALWRRRYHPGNGQE